MSASLFRQDSGALFLVRLGSPRPEAVPGAEDPRALLLQTLASIPDGFVVTDPSGRITATSGPGMAWPIKPGLTMPSAAHAPSTRLHSVWP